MYIKDNKQLVDIISREFLGNKGLSIDDYIGYISKPFNHGDVLALHLLTRMGNIQIAVIGHASIWYTHTSKLEDTSPIATDLILVYLGKNIFRCTKRRPSRSGGNTWNAKFTCANCGKGFIYESELSVHSSVHSETKPFTCPYPGCNRKYKNRSQVQRHIKTHRNLSPKVHCKIEGCHYSGDQKGLKQQCWVMVHPLYPVDFVQQCSIFIAKGSHIWIENITGRISVQTILFLLHTVAFTFST